MKRLLILVGVFLGLADSAIAQKPSCITTPTSSHPNFWSYHFGDYTSSAGSCSLQSGQGVELQFDITPGSGTGITSHFSIDIANSNRPPIESLTWTDSDPNVMYRMDRKIYEQSQPTLQKIPNWVTQIIDQNQDIFRRRIPKGYAAWEKVFAEQKIIDASTFRDSLNAMNAGQLFAKADELSSSGDAAKAREVLRALVSRFPDHPLAAQAANQLSNLSSGGGSRQADSGAGVNTNSSKGSAQAGSSGISGRPFEECLSNEKKNTAMDAKLLAIPKNDTVKLLRGGHFASRWLVENYSQCLPDPRAKEQVDGFRKTMAETMQTCKQLSSNPSICEVSPF